MNAKNIFKAVAFALAMPAMLLTSACSSDEVIEAEQAPASHLGYVTDVTITVGNDASSETRTFYDGKNNYLEFTKGDQLLCCGDDGGGAGRYALLADFQSGNTFYGKLYTQNPYTGNVMDLFKKGRITVDLLPAGYENFGHLELTGEGYLMGLSQDESRTFSPSMQLALEQFLDKTMSHYTEEEGVLLQSSKGVVCFTLTGLEASKSYRFTLRETTTSKRTFDISGIATTDNTGTATFSIAKTPLSSKYNQLSIIIDDGAKYMDINLGYKKINRAEVIIADPISVTAKQVIDLSTKPAGEYVAEHGKILTGTLPDDAYITILDGATVVLRDAVINSTVMCMADATIILEGENTIKGISAGILAGVPGKTVTIKGNGQLTVEGAAGTAAIGSGEGSTCGNITILGGNIIAKGGTDAAAIGTGNGGTCGKIFIDGGSVDATGVGRGAAIGTGNAGTCGDIVIRDAISVFAKKGVYAIHSVGKGSDDSTIGKVTIGGFEGAKSESSYTYPETRKEEWKFYEAKYFDLAAGKDYHPLTTGSTLRSNGISSGSVVDGHMQGKFYFIAPYNRKFTNITITGKSHGVTGEGWSSTSTAAVWEGTPAQYVHVDCDIEDVTLLLFTYQ